MADGDAYHEGHLYATAWTGATSDNKAKALVMATRLVDAGYQFNGVQASSTQALQWPRENCPDPDQAESSGALAMVASDAVPKAVLHATCELARALLVADRTADPMGEGIKSSWLGSTGQVFDKADRRPVIPRLAQNMLGKFGVMRGARSVAVRLVRV